MLEIIRSSAFKRDVKRARKRGWDMSKLISVIYLLVSDSNQQLSAFHRDHSLKGQWLGYRELHIGPDWLLIYYIENGTLYLVKTGTHAELFDE